jgi:S1-C subfamily serine protease
MKKPAIAKSNSSATLKRKGEYPSDECPSGESRVRARPSFIDWLRLHVVSLGRQTERIVIARVAFIAILASVGIRPLGGLAQPVGDASADRMAALAAMEQTLVEAIARAEPSIVAISRAAPAQAAQTPFSADDLFGDLRPTSDIESAPPVVAAGVIIDRSGLVLTQYLAVRENEAPRITTIEGKTYPARIRAADPRSGLAVLVIAAPNSPRRAGESNAGAAPAGSFPAIRFGDAAQLRKGQFVIAIGNPFGIVSDGQPTASWGVVTNLARKAPPGANLNDAPGPFGDYRTTLHHLGTLIQTDAKLGWSAGGGALVNLQGELIGLTTTAATIAGHEQPAGYAIPLDATTRRIIDVLKEGREVEYGMLGISFGGGAQPTAGPAGRVVVGQVFRGGPAARAGLQTGDIVLRVNHRPITDSDALQLAVSALPPSTKTTIEYERGGRTSTVEVQLAKLAVAGKKIVTVWPESWRGIRVDYATALEAADFVDTIASNAYDEEGCVLVADVEPGSPAAKAGVCKGMFISHVGNQRVTTPEEFRAAVRHVGDELDIRLTQPIEPPAPAKESDANAPSGRRNPR